MSLIEERMKWIPKSKDKIKVVKDAMSDDDSQAFIDFIDNNLNIFTTDASRSIPNRYILRFGYDEVWEDSKPDLTMLMPIKDLVEKYRSIMVNNLKSLYGDEEIYLTSFHLGKQGPGAKVLRHLDGGTEVNAHFKYSAILYLNTVEVGGELTFPNLYMSVKPNKNEMVAFPAYDGIIFDHEVSMIGSDRYCIPCWFTSDKSLELKFPDMVY
jgi:Rps23 Pro-64 3,4-dihydroxylase Tpa1-like proline 4-hydroxylase